MKTRTILRIPGLSDPLLPPQPLFAVVPLRSFAGRTTFGWIKNVEAPNARAALLKARHELLDAYMAERGLVADGWYVARWDEHGGWVDDVFVEREEVADGNDDH